MKKDCEGACDACKNEDSEDCKMCGGCMCMGAAHACHDSEGKNKEACEATQRCDEEGVYDAILAEATDNDPGANADFPSDALEELGAMVEVMSDE